MTGPPAGPKPNQARAMPPSPAEKDRFGDRLLMTAVLLALPPLTTIVVASLLYYLGWRALLASLAVSYAAVYGLFLFRRREAGLVLISLGLTAASLGLAVLFYDMSVDGRIHLQESVIQLAFGWNPTETDVPASRVWWGGEWINYYPAGLQILGAAFYKLTGSLQAAKGYNFIFWWAALAASWSVLRSAAAPRLSRWLALALIANPVVISQLWTFYIDGSLYLIFLIGLALLLHLRPGLYFNDERKARDLRGRLVLASALACVLVLPVIKISGLALAAFLYLLLAYQLRSRPGLIGLLSLAGMALFYIVGYKPYFMYNLYEILARLHMANPLPHGLDGHCPVVGQFLNYFGSPAATYELSRVVFSTDFNVRFNSSGGLYGVIFGLVWLWSLAYLFKLTLRDRLSGTNRFLIFLFAITNLAPVFYPMFINQRYFPIQYIFPVAMLGRYSLGASRTQTALAAVMVGAILINPLGVLADTLARNVIYTTHINESLARLAAGPPQPYRQAAVEDRLSAFRPSHLPGPEPGQSPADYYATEAVFAGDELSALRLSRMLSNRFFFKDLGEPVFLPTLEPNWPGAVKRFNGGRPSSSRVLVNGDGLMVIVEREAASASGGRAEMVKIDFAEIPNKGFGEIMMYLQDDRSEAYSRDFDRYFRWSVTGQRPTQFLDIPPRARRVLIVPGQYLKIKQAEIREVDFPETITPEALSLP